MKKCTRCNEEKPLEEFYKYKLRKDGRNSHCKKCDYKIRKSNYRTVRGRVLQIYSSQKTNSKHRGHQQPTYTKEEFIDWMLSNEDYLRLHAQWVDSGFKKSLAPSCDRLDDYKGYRFDNIRVITWDENNKKGHLYRKIGLNNKHSKSVVKIDLNGEKLEEYYSVSQAAREMNLHYSSILAACNGKSKTSGGFKWKYAEHT